MAPATPRPAASLILLRRSGKHRQRGVEVLLVRRSPEASFMPGVWVFPGGVVEADESVGPKVEAEASAGDGEELAHRACAVRELHEEAGIELSADAQLLPWSRWITPELVLQRASRRKVEFESLDFNRRFLATVPSEYDPVALREVFSPAFLEWVTTIDNEIDFGVSEQQLWFLWRLGDRTRDQLEAALDNGGELFKRVRKEVEESGVHTYPAGPWHAGLEPFPAS